MKKMPFILLIPMIGILVVVGVAAVYRLFFADATIPAKASNQYPNALNNQQAKPSTFLGGLLGGATPSPTPATAIDLSNELKSTYDDGGQSDLDALEAEASAL